ncbi:MAG TPA: TonB-dependent receptor [Thermoanaerobaculia bacterium]|nr:TonB-dependent receptor [Thermoanaerobaculia bacterium]
MTLRDIARRAALVLILSVFAVLPSASVRAAMAVAGQVRGQVVGPDGKPLPGVTVVLANEISGYRQQVSSGKDGAYLLYNVPINPYHLTASLEGFAPVHIDLDVRGAAPVVRDIALRLAATASTTVQAEREPVALETDDPSTHLDIDKSLIQRAPAAIPSRAFESIVMSTPGFSQDENGRYHFQGGHSQQLLVIDGQPIGDQIGITFSNSLDPAVAENVTIITGGIPAEYGEKANGVINLTTRSGLGYERITGDVSLVAASFSTFSGNVSAGGGNSRFGWFTTLDASTSDRFLDPVSFDNFHNRGQLGRGFLRLDSVSGDQSSSWRLTGNIGETKRDVTNLPSQEAAGQDQRVESNDWNVNLGYQKVFPGTWVLEAQIYARDNRLTLYSSPYDTPVQAEQNRSLQNQGLNLALSKTVGINELKIGLQAKRFPIQEQFSFLITDPAFNDPTSDGYNPNLAPYDGTRGGSPFYFSGSKTGAYVAGFIQDSIRWNDLTVNVGLRYDHNFLFESENQLQPRVGVAYFLKATNTVFRASYNRMFITPEYENILLSSSPQAASITPPDIQDSQQLGGGQLYNLSERHDVYNAGIQQGIGSKLRLDVSYWYRNVKNAADQDQFFNTGIVFPLNFATGTLHGWNVRLDLAPVLGGLHGYASVGHVYAQYCNPFVGGLFLSSDALSSFEGGCFLIDHDQNIQEQVGLIYDVGKTGLWAGVTQRYDSGLVTDAGTSADVLSSPDTAYADPYIRYDTDPQRIKSRTIWNFSLGAGLQKVGLPLELEVDLLNAFDVKGLYNFLSTFGGTHVIPPRTLAGRVKFVF